jgi:hypothetical protein
LYHRWPEEEEDVDDEADAGYPWSCGGSSFVEEFHQVAFDVQGEVAPAKPAKKPEYEAWRRELHRNYFLNVVLIWILGKKNLLDSL